MKIGVLASISLSLLIGFSVAATAGMAPDQDTDGIPDAMDNCVTLANAAPNDCDTDNDGYGNVCDGDFDNNNLTTAGDFGIFFVPDLTGPGTDSGAGTDMDCNGLVTAGDFGIFFVPQLTGTGKPGPSGLGCAGAPPCM